MPSALVSALHEKHGLPHLGCDDVDAFLDASPVHALLMFAGEARLECDDVAVVMPELLKAFAGRLRGALIARAAEDALKARFHVVVTPSLVVARGRETLDVIAKIRDWSEYSERLSAALRPQAVPLAQGAGPQTQFRINGAKVDA